MHRIVFPICRSLFCASFHSGVLIETQETVKTKVDKCPSVSSHLAMRTNRCDRKFFEMDVSETLAGEFAELNNLLCFNPRVIRSIGNGSIVFLDRNRL